jgi:hypothetical protein
VLLRDGLELLREFSTLFLRLGEYISQRYTSLYKIIS